MVLQVRSRGKVGAGVFVGCAVGAFVGRPVGAFVGRSVCSVVPVVLWRRCHQSG